MLDGNWYLRGRASVNNDKCSTSILYWSSCTAVCFLKAQVTQKYIKWPSLMLFQTSMTLSSVKIFWRTLRFKQQWTLIIQYVFKISSVLLRIKKVMQSWNNMMETIFIIFVELSLWLRYSAKLFRLAWLSCDGWSGSKCFSFSVVSEHCHVKWNVLLTAVWGFHRVHLNCAFPSIIMS